MQRKGWFLLVCLVFNPPLLMAQEQAEIQDFTYVKSIDLRTDEDRSIILTGRTEGDDGVIALAWACRPEGLHVMVTTNPLGFQSEWVLVYYRFPPKEPTAPESWDATDHEAWWMPLTLVPSFTEEAKGESRVVIGVNGPPDWKYRTAAFSLKGLGEALTRLPCYHPAGVHGKPSRAVSSAPEGGPLTSRLRKARGSIERLRGQRRGAGFEVPEKC